MTSQLICTKRENKDNCKDCLYENFLFIQWPCTKCYSKSAWAPVPEGADKPERLFLSK